MKNDKLIMNSLFQGTFRAEFLTVSVGLVLGLFRPPLRHLEQHFAVSLLALLAGPGLHLPGSHSRLVRRAGQHSQDL